MTMKNRPSIYTKAQLAEMLYERNAVALWDQINGPPYWYAANVPGPLYVNTEKIIGEINASNLLDTIDDILSADPTSEGRSPRIRHVIMEEFDNNIQYQKVISTLLKIIDKVDLARIRAISGGERRDWLFSIPIAGLIGMDHFYLYKSGSYYLSADQHISSPSSKSLLHIADLIHNASSYFDCWLPTTLHAGFRIIATCAVLSRGSNGLMRLRSKGISAEVLQTIDDAYFEQLSQRSIINKARSKELEIYFRSNKYWFIKYLMKDISVFLDEKLDQKSRLRMSKFFESDPWNISLSDKAALTELRKVTAPL